MQNRNAYGIVRGSTVPSQRIFGGETEDDDHEDDLKNLQDDSYLYEDEEAPPWWEIINSRFKAIIKFFGEEMSGLTSIQPPSASQQTHTHTHTHTYTQPCHFCARYLPLSIRPLLLLLT